MEFFKKILKRFNLIKTKKKSESEEFKITATKEEIEKIFNELVKNNHLKLSKETLSHIGGFKIFGI